jgi:hypothetical protein
MKFINRIWTAFRQGPIFVIAFGLIFFGIGAGMTYQQWLLRQQALEVPGTVISLSESCDDDGCTYRPNVRFTTQSGQTEIYNSSFGSSPPAYKVGETVTIFYRPDNPQKATIKGEGAVLRFVFAGIGGGIIIFGLAFFANNIKNSYLEEA